VSQTVQHFALTPQQIAWFETFGFLRVRGLFTPDIERIRTGFEEVFAREAPQLLDPDNIYHRTSDPDYEQETRWIIPSFLDKSDKLSWLRSDDRLLAIARALVGADYVYAESDGNLFNCEVYWHMDAYGAAADATHVKIFFYLDALQEDTGALRVIPGSQHRGTYMAALFRQLTKDPARIPDLLGVAINEIPSTTLVVEPGDVIITDFHTIHASFKGGARRRLFTVNFRAPTEAE
jgi:hypothetical protein